MKRLIAIILLVSLFSGCICPSSSQQSSTSEGAPTTQSQSGGGITTQSQSGGGITTQSQSGGAPTTQSQSGGGITEKLTDLATAISSGQSYNCKYTYSDVESEISVKGNKFRSQTTTQGITYNTVSDGVWAYSWQEGQKTGTKMNIQELENNVQ
ncbi:MAG: hypothetical protein V1703_00450, partial [Candidatus Altiarchaeota archaeon]